MRTGAAPTKIVRKSAKHNSIFDVAVREKLYSTNLHESSESLKQNSNNSGKYTLADEAAHLRPPPGVTRLTWAARPVAAGNIHAMARQRQ